jgi:homeobox protein cut-like
VSPTLKTYQAEIESLTKHCQDTENASIDLFKLIINVPDPFPVIELVRQFKETDIYDQIQKLQNENKHLKEALNAYSSEISLMNKQGKCCINEPECLLKINC